MNSYLLFLPVLVGALIPVQAKLNGKLLAVNGNAIFTSLVSVRTETDPESPENRESHRASGR